MKEYKASTGGRYTYADDLLNLQDLALSYSSIFHACTNFVISGCEIEDGNIREGFIWLGNKVRHFGGCNNISYPFYIFENNQAETTTYANDVNKTGRINYLSTWGNNVPAIPDSVTGKLPEYIEVKENYIPRLLDKFFGKYAVLLETPFSKQTIKKDLVVAGDLSIDKNVESKTAISVINPAKGYALKNIVRADGCGSVGLYLNGLLINEIVLNTNGTFALLKGTNCIATFNDAGLLINNATLNTLRVSSISVVKNIIENSQEHSDNGSIDINVSGYNNEGVFYRNFNVYNGRNSQIPIFSTEGKSGTVRINGNFEIQGNNPDINIINTVYNKSDNRLLNAIRWRDSNKDEISCIGFISGNNLDFTVKNNIGNLIISPKNYVDIIGELRLRGTNIKDIYVDTAVFNDELYKKVSKVEGKQLSTEDFTTELKAKLTAIKTGSLPNATTGYATVTEIVDALDKKISKLENLGDIPDKKIARINLDVFSKSETNGLFLKISQNLLELVSLSADEINGLTPEQAGALKSNKQKAVRDNIDAEKKGTGDLKLAKASNLSDVPDKAQARKNISVYSTEEVDKKLEKYLPLSSEYTGAVFTNEHKQKLEAIKTGNFAGIDNENKPVSQTEGYVLTSHVIKELGKKANLLMDGYNDTQKKTIASNLGIYNKDESDLKYASIEDLFQDFITFLVKQGKSSAEAQMILRDKLNCPGKEDVSNHYLRKDGKLNDLILSNADAKKAACKVLGAAYAEEYQTKIIDTGWIKMNNSGGNTYANDLYIRQIGNIVSIQGTVYNNRHDGTHWGGTLAVIPNQIQPPKYAVKNSLCEFNDDHKYNRGATYVIWGGDRRLIMYESGWYGATELNFTYMV